MAKIVMVNTVCRGSHGRIMMDLKQAAEAIGFEVTIAFGRGDALEKGSLRIGTKAGVLTHVALTRLFDRHGLGSRSATSAFLSQLVSMKPNLLHLHNIHGYYLHIEMLFAFIRETGIPTLWTLHDCWAFTGHCSHYARASCVRWQSGCFHCPLKKEYPTSLCLDASKLNWHRKRAAFSGIRNLTLATPANWLADDLVSSFLGDTNRVVIPNGVDLSLFCPVPAADIRKEHGVRPYQRLLLAVASPFDERKGFRDVCKVAELLGESAKVMMVGLVPEQMHGLPENVIGIQRTDGPEALVALYCAADCLINPTYEDTFPTVNLEALACGTPVAAYCTGGCPEQIELPVGAVVPYGDFQRLAQAAIKLAASKCEISAQCRAYAERRFDRNRMLNQYVALYQKLTGA